MILSELLEEFLFQKRLAGLVEGSVHNYSVTVGLMVTAVGPQTPLEGITYERITNYILNLLESPISRATASSYIRNDRIFLRWVHTEYGLPFDPARIKVPKFPKKNVHIYTDDEIKYIFSLATTSIPWITARNQAIIAFMLDSGLRQCEVCSLLLADIDRKRMIMKVTGKGAKDRMVPLGNMALYFLNRYRDISPYVDSKYAFVDRRGNQLSGNAVRLFVYRLEKKLPFKFSSHKLRHNFATNFCIDNMRESGKTCVYDLSILMGHESIETTKKYEHFAHELVAAENSISHLDNVFKAI